MTAPELPLTSAKERLCRAGRSFPPRRSNETVAAAHLQYSLADALHGDANTKLYSRGCNVTVERVGEADPFVAYLLLDQSADAF